MRIAAGDELLGRHQHHGIGALDLAHDFEHGRFRGRAVRAGAGEQVHDHLGVARGLEYGAVVLERRTQRRGVGYSAVLGKADSAFAVSGRYGLDILPEIAAEIVAHVSDADLPFHAGEHVAAEHVVDKSVVLVRGQLSCRW